VLERCLNALREQPQKLTSQQPGRRNCTANSTSTASTFCKISCPNGDFWKGKSIYKTKGKDRRQIVFYPTPLYPQGKTDKPVYPSTPNGVHFYIILFTAAVFTALWTLWGF
jgi:hypothetical protein